VAVVVGILLVVMVALEAVGRVVQGLTQVLLLEQSIQAEVGVLDTTPHNQAAAPVL
jgi:hypothetical protein